MKERVLSRAKARGNTIQFQLVNSETVTRRKAADRRRLDLEGSYLVACESISYEKGCYEEPKLRASSSGLQVHFMKERVLCRAKACGNTMQFELVNREKSGG